MSNNKYRTISNRFATVAAVSFILLSFTLARDARAHAQMVRSNPAKNAELTKAPEQVELWFNELLDDGFNSVEVFAAAELSSQHHASLTRGEAAVDPNDRTHLTVKLAPLPAGEYVVAWRVLSRDGHSAPGRLTFRVAGAK
jgi:methionine-rich copper-binding protein CopC